MIALLTSFAPDRLPAPFTSCGVTQQIVSIERLGLRKYSAAIVGTKLVLACVCALAGRPMQPEATRGQT
jgi:hypothetical protein